MLAVTVYSVFVKTWGKGTAVMKGYEMILQDESHPLIIIGNIVAFVVTTCCKNFYQCPYKIRFQILGWYRIIVSHY
jgi:undecaprenyl-diphosphatase